MIYGKGVQDFNLLSLLKRRWRGNFIRKSM